MSHFNYYDYLQILASHWNLHSDFGFSAVYYNLTSTNASLYVAYPNLAWVITNLRERTAWNEIFVLDL